MYKAIFSDLDATLLTSDKRISKTDIEAINEAKKKGVKFLFCTGRLPFCYKMFEEEVDTSNAISTNGEIIFSDGKIIRNKYLNKKDAEAAIRYAIEHKEYMRIFTFDYLYLLNAHKGGDDVNFYKESSPISDEDAIKLVDKKNIYKVSFYCEHNHLLDIEKDIKKLNLNIDMTFTSPTFLELLLKGESKGNGIIEYCKYNNIDIKNTIGIGDEDNDLPMLKVVGLSCCPANAKESIKEKCNYVTKANNNESAIAEIIKKYVI